MWKRCVLVCGAWILSAVFIATAPAEHYHGQDEYGWDDPDGYARSYVQHRRIYRRPMAESGVSEVYYACPQGDFISDRPGECPLDGSRLIPRRSSQDRERIY